MKQTERWQISGKRLVALVVLLATSFVSAAQDEAGAVDYVTIIGSTKAFEGATPDLRDILLSIARLASEHNECTEEFVRRMPNVESKSNGAFLKGTKDDSNGVHLEIMYNLRERRPAWVLRTFPDKSAVNVGFGHREGQNMLGLHSGYVKISGGQRAVEIWFDDEELARPRWAVPMTGPSLVLGVLVAWDNDGNRIVEREISEPSNPLEVRMQVLESLDTNELDALGASIKDRLCASLAFRLVDGVLQRSMENVAGWSERFLEAEPSEFVDLLSARDMQVDEEGEDVVYRIDVAEGEPDWTIVQDRVSGHIEAATRGEVALYFDTIDDRRWLAGGRCPVRKDELANRYWLMSFYPGKCSPRVVIATTGDSPTNLFAEGKVYAWSPKGETLVEKEIVTATPVADVVGEIDATLSDQQKAGMNWRGPQEAKYLLGEY